MSIQNDLLELFQTPQFRYKGMSVNIFGLPTFKGYKRNSINTALSRLKKKEYITFQGSCLRLSENGKRYIAKRKARLQLFKSPFSEESSKNLLFSVKKVRLHYDSAKCLGRSISPTRRIHELFEKYKTF
ncbi:MAG: hypothetical protein US18_C0043G0006 [Parcubacteria group bacterium GW2011_GWB1_36_5]|nr:MAG: hypothetical protein US18_C0043G0006 [Parcubacteria group bacterium GW2011_GWB1_36_5]